MKTSSLSTQDSFVAESLILKENLPSTDDIYKKAFLKGVAHGRANPNWYNFLFVKPLPNKVVFVLCHENCLSICRYKAEGYLESVETLERYPLDYAAKWAPINFSEYHYDNC